FRRVLFRSVRVPDGGLVRVEVPDDAVTDVHREWLLVRLRSPWTVGGATHPAGALLVTRLDAFLAGARDLTVLFEPDDRTSLSYHAWTREHLLLVVMADVRTRLEVRSPGAAGWRQAVLDEPAEFAHTDILDTNRDVSDEYLLSAGGFLQPPTVRYGRVGSGGAETLKQGPAFFDATGMSVRQ